MKRTKILPTSMYQLLPTLLKNDVHLKSLLYLSVFVIVAALVWFAGPLISWKAYIPLAQPEKRIYVILFLLLAWLLKFLLVDLDASNPYQYKDSQTRKKLHPLQQQFYGAMHFLKKTIITKHNRQVRLAELPWYLLIGPHNAGKTSLLANSAVNFILQRQFQQNVQQLTASASCNWWVTRDASIIDVPGRFLSALDPIKNSDQKMGLHPMLWRFLLRLIKRQRGKHGIDGIILAIPFPEIMLQGDSKKYQGLLRNIFQRLYELQKQFPQPIPCHLLITKCDLLPGFSPFFAELGEDETAQAWGVVLPEPQGNDKLHDVFGKRFNALIKRINQQLITHLHQERNPQARPAIKDFPLQIERLKEFTIDFIKKLSATPLSLSLQSVYLSSALQAAPDAASSVFAEINDAALPQVFKEPNLASRPYFIKQFITHGIIYSRPDYQPVVNKQVWKRRAVYAASIGVISCAAIILGRDFEHGVEKAYAIQNDLSQYRLALQNFHNPDEKLIKTLGLLDTLQLSVTNLGFKLDLSHLLTFYSYKSQQKANQVYHQALETLLMSEMKEYLEDYLKVPVNKNTDVLYAALKTYLMLGDVKRAQPDIIMSTVRAILPKNFTEAETARLMQHLNLALHSPWAAQPLDNNIIAKTREFLTATPTAQLSYIILKNINDNNVASGLDLGINVQTNATFVSPQLTNAIPVMFTAKTFSTILAQEIVTAAEEAALGNWVLGPNANADVNRDIITAQIDQLRATYINNYVDIWESLLANVSLSPVKDLAQEDVIIVSLMSKHSPMLHLLHTLYANTYFEPIINASPRLQNVNLLVDRNHQNDNILYQIFAGLQSLHEYLQQVLTAKNEKKAAFELLSARLQHKGAPDAITQLRLIADKSPEPVKNWLNQIANDTWHLLMQDASRYINTAWQEKVVRFYQADIANRYPFEPTATQDVEIPKFTAFFGNPGLILRFYNHYIQRLVDTSQTEWHWKMIDNEKLPFPDESLRQLQHALRIHQAFFPNGDNKLYVQFALEAHQFSPNVKKLQLTINDKQISDDNNPTHSSHVITWPSNSTVKMTSMQITLTNHKMVGRDFPGTWGWFKLVSQSFESASSQKQMLLNFAENDAFAKYKLFMQKSNNPFLSLNLSHFALPQESIV